MRRLPDYGVGDVVEFKSGTRGTNFGLVNGMRFSVTKVCKPRGKGEWGGYMVYLKETPTMVWPAGWFKKVVVKEGNE